MSHRPSGHTAVMASRTEAPDSLDYFPTPPWATRALCEHIIVGVGGLSKLVAWEPAAGEGYMAEVLREYFAHVYASDVHDYGRSYAVGSFVGQGPDCADAPAQCDWIITNPPFNLGIEFALRGLDEAKCGVALLLRSVWTEGKERYETLFRDRAPTTIATFCERVPMTKGKWDPDASTATSYAWFIWQCGERKEPTRFVWIPPGQRKALERKDDRQRFAWVPA